MAEAPASSVESPSGKNAVYENFPVGSWLLPARLRPHVAVFYAFARAIDDIADSPVLPSEVKINRLEGFSRALRGEECDTIAYAKAVAMRETLDATGVSEQHCLDLIAAFKQDAFKRRYTDWADLLDYCYKSASPVGRFLLDLHGGCRYGYGASDALCNALQVINHLQDCRDDYLDLDRVYLPMDWLDEAEGDVEDLALPRSTPALRRVFDRVIDGAESLMVHAESLPRGLNSRRLAMESAAIIDIAWTLLRRLRAEDPLAARIQLTKLQYAWSVSRGALSVWL